MQQYLIALSLLIAMSAPQCSKQNQNVPACIQAKIETIKKEPRWNPPAEVLEYMYNGRRVFLFSSNCCDQFNQVYDEECQLICAASGGITGKGDGRCADFNDKAKLVRVVWKDPRP